MILGVPILKHFRVDPLPEGFCNPGTPTGTHKSHISLKKRQKMEIYSFILWGQQNGNLKCYGIRKMNFKMVTCISKFVQTTE